jgi:phosphate-selective porin OprO and OprP
MKKLFLGLILSTVSFINFAQSTNDILELLIKNKSITQAQADSIRAEAAIKQQDLDANKKSFFITTNRMMQLSGYTQIRYQNQDAKGAIDGFDIRRARLDLKGDLTPYFSYRLQTDFAGTPKLMDAYADIKLLKFLTITIGQTKIPFSLENITPDNTMEAIDRSQVVEALVARTKDVIGNQNGRDIGLQIGGSLIKYKNRYLFDYGIGVFNGAGINIADKNENKDVIGRLALHPIKGLGLGGSFYTGKGNFGTPTPTNQDRSRYGTELSYENKNFTFRGEYISGKDGVTKRNGWYAQAGYYIIPKKFQLIVKYDVYDPDTSLSNNLSTNYVLGGTYNFNSWSKIQAGYTFNNTEGSVVVHNNLGVVQYQISF